MLVSRDLLMNSKMVWMPYHRVTLSFTIFFDKQLACLSFLLFFGGGGEAMGLVVGIWKNHVSHSGWWFYIHLDSS